MTTKDPTRPPSKSSLLRNAWPMVLALLAFFLAAGDASAQVFTPIRPTDCASGHSYVPFTYQVGGTASELPIDPNCVFTPCPTYANAILHDQRVVGNQWTTTFGLNFVTFNTEAGYDFLKWGRALYGIWPEQTISGVQAAFWADISASSGLASTFGAYEFLSDYVVTRPGFRAASARLCSALSVPDSGPPAALAPYVENVGVMLGNNDVVYGTLAYEVGGNHTTLVLRAYPGVSADFDVYARCGAIPTPSQWTWRGFSSNSDEYIDLGTGCSSGQTLYVAVHSFWGSGQFYLVRGRHKATHEFVLSARTWNFVPTPTELSNISNMLALGSKRFFAATEGDQVVSRIDLYTNGSTSGFCNQTWCNVLIYNNNSATANSYLCDSGTISLYQAEFDADGDDAHVFAHELGHLRYCAGDEYINGRCATDCSLSCGSASCPGGCATGIACDRCGHSIMADLYFNKTRNTNMCTNLDHGWDRDPGAPFPTLSPAHQQAYSAGASLGFTNATYDNFDYSTHDFNDQVGVVNVIP